MKKTILTFQLLFIFAFSLCHAQSIYIWNTMQSNTNERLRFTHLNYAVGGNGTILRLAGDNWQILNSGGGFELRSLYQFNALIAVGTEGNIMRSTNSGSNWIQANSPVTQNLNSISRGISGPTLVFTAVGDNGSIITSTNFGANWQIAQSPTNSNLNSVFYSTLSNNNFGIITGNNGAVFRTTNVGNSWTDVGIGLGEHYYNIFFLQENTTGWICGDGGIILKTTDSGISWNQVANLGNIKLNSIYFFNSNVGYVCGEDGFIYRSTDGGLSWNFDNNYLGVNLNSIFAISETSVKAVGDNGVILQRELNPITLPYLPFTPNNLTTWISNTGIFNQDLRSMNTPGLQWPAGSSKFVGITSGLTIIANVNNSLRMASAAYDSEFKPGYTINGNYFTDSTFFPYRVKSTDSVNSYYWQKWGNAVEFGAPFVDVNGNGIYEPGIDIPGVKDASETVFLCLSDADRTNVLPTGWAGGSLPLGAQLQITFWGYDLPGLNNVHFVEYKIINKSSNWWDGVYFTLFNDSDIGNGGDDYIGSDTILNLGYTYNANPMDGNGTGNTYGSLPPALGYKFLKTPHYLGNEIGLTSNLDAKCAGCGISVNCELNPVYQDFTGAYNFARGFKKDLTPWVIPNTNPPVVTKFNYSGDPETQTGWTSYNGKVLNCGGSLTGEVLNVVPPSDVRLVINSGNDQFIMAPGDTQTVVIAQMVAQGSNNRNSVTKLKQLAANVQAFFDNNQMLENSVSGVVRFADNNQPLTEGHVKALRLNKADGSIEILDSAQIGSNGAYLLPNVPVDSVYIVAYPNSENKSDFIPSYYPTGIYWTDATVIFPITSLSNVDIGVTRAANLTGNNSVSGNVFIVTNADNTPAKDAVIFAKSGSDYFRFDLSITNGSYQLPVLTNGDVIVIADRIGYSRDSVSVSLSGNSQLTDVNLFLNQVYVGIANQSEEIPVRYILHQNYPNPFNPVTKIRFEIPVSEHVRIKVYDMLGREVASLVNQSLQAGVYEYSFDASGLGSGVYFYRLQTGSFIDTKRMVVLK